MAEYLREWRLTATGKTSTQRSNLKKVHDMTLEEKAALFAKQGNKCAICGTKVAKRWCLDHNHFTGQDRGIICTNCNFVLGHSFESVERLKAAIAYIRKWTRKGPIRS